MAEPRPRETAETVTVMAHSLGGHGFSGCMPLGLVTGTGRDVCGMCFYCGFCEKNQVTQGKQVSIGEFDKLQQILECGN